MVDHPRSDWLPAGSPFTGPVFEPGRIDRIVIHYIGTPRAPRDAKVWMLNTHQMTMRRTPPYVFMYNWHVALDGGSWEGRGFTLRNAANKETNSTTVSIVFGVDGQNPASEKQVAAGRRLVAGIRDRCGRELPLVGHRDVAATSCPGDGIYRQLRAGVFEPVVEEDVDMVIVDWRHGRPEWTACVYTGTQLAWVVNGHADQVLRQVNPKRVPVSDDQFLGLIQSVQTTTPAPPTVTSQMRAAWNANRLK